jgi:hypothetical protein
VNRISERGRNTLLVLVMILLVLTLALTVANTLLINQTISMIQKQPLQQLPLSETVILLNRTQISLEPPLPFYSLNVSEYYKVCIYYQGVQGDIQTDWGVSFGLTNLNRSDVFLLPDVATFSISNEIRGTQSLDVQGPYLFIICRQLAPGQNNTNSIILYLT